MFRIVVIKQSFIFSSDISFEIIKTFFLCTNAVYATILMVNLLLPAFDGIAKAIVSPFLIPLKTLVRIGNGISKPCVKLFAPSSKNWVSPLFNIADLNFPVTVTWFIAASTSSIDILSYSL